MSIFLRSFVVASALLVTGCGGGSGSASNAPLSGSDSAKAQSMSNCLLANSTAQDQSEMRQILASNPGEAAHEDLKNKFAIRSVQTAVNRCGVPVGSESDSYFGRGMEDYMKTLAARSI